MKIELIDSQEYGTLLRTYKNHPILTLQNKGYEKPDKSKFTEADYEAYNKVSDILNKHIIGFSSFSNYKLAKDGELGLRFQYNWTADEPAETRGLPFVGVGYLLVDELLYGFKIDKDETN